MFKYFCLVVLVSTVNCAPLDEENDVTPLVKDVVTGVNPADSDPLHVSSQAFDEQVVDDPNIENSTKKAKIVEILESGSDHKTDGSYSFHYRGADGTFREETAVVKNAGTDNEYLEITGAYSFFDVDGKEVIVRYKADDRGFVPEGNNIPDIISEAARQNSQLPDVKKDTDSDVDGEDDDNVNTDANEDSNEEKVNSTDKSTY